ncbi:MAG: 23S rRNA (uracil(1939)-C(5))-methyltransferase RlmD [Alphaproteobacteria bacterium]|nr:23S rRNA (uracil(1939)-C(5))-methyltransferase RlmD [Alphaproteobacteria bacterium]
MKAKTPPQISEEIGKVMYLTPHGMGRIQDDDGKEFDLPYCLPGETVRYEKVKRKRHTDYYFREVIKPSPNRNAPICPHFTRCGGCTLQHLNASEYAEFKKSIVTNHLQQYGLDVYVVQDPVILKAGQRRRTNMDIRKRKDTIFLGYHQLKSYSVTNIGPCPVLDPAIECLLDPLSACLDQVLENYQSAKIFITNTDVGIDASLEIQEIKELTPQQRQILSDFAQSHNLCRFMFRYRKTRDILHVREQPYVVIDGIAVSVDPWSFLQSSKAADDHLTQWVLSHVSPSSTGKIYDLFCGRGTFTFPLSRVRETVGVELDQHALQALDSANQALGVDARPITLIQQNLFEEPLKASTFNPDDIVVIDPPRAGAQMQCEELARSRVGKIIYVSCNPETFARDCQILEKGGYTLTMVYVLDQFIYTPHLEVVGILERL